MRIDVPGLSVRELDFHLKARGVDTSRKNAAYKALNPAAKKTLLLSKLPRDMTFEEQCRALGLRIGGSGYRVFSVQFLGNGGKTDLVVVGPTGDLAASDPSFAVNGRPGEAMLALVCAGFLEINFKVHFHPMYLRSFVTDAPATDIQRFTRVWDDSKGDPPTMRVPVQGNCSWDMYIQRTGPVWNLIGLTGSSRDQVATQIQQDRGAGKSRISSASKVENLTKLWQAQLLPLCKRNDEYAARLYAFAAGLMQESSCHEEEGRRKALNQAKYAVAFSPRPDMASKRKKSGGESKAGKKR
jgi:hypothetical protein